MKFFCPRSHATFAIIGLTSLALGGCSENTDSAKETDEPAPKATASTQTIAPGTWRKNYKEADELFQIHKYHDMVRLLESTKAQAKSEGGTTLEYGKYLDRMAKAHSWAIEYRPAAECAKEAIDLFIKVKAPSTDLYAANWFAGISLTQLTQYKEALPYLLKAQEISRDPANAGVGTSLPFLYKSLERCYKGSGDEAGLTALKKEKHARHIP